MHSALPVREVVRHDAPPGFLHPGRPILGSRNDAAPGERSGCQDDSQLVHNPGPSNPRVSMRPSLTSKMPGKRFSHPRLAAGTYSLELASSADTPGTCAAMPTECTSAAPGHVRSCTHRNILYFCAAAASNSVCD